MPILFEEILTKSELPKINVVTDSFKGEGNLLVFLHGFQGSSQDTLIMKNTMYLRFPGSQTLCSEANKGKT